MKVYCLLGTFYHEGDTLLGVFSSFEIAESMIKVEGNFYDLFSIEERDIDSTESNVVYTWSPE